MGPQAASNRIRTERKVALLLQTLYCRKILTVGVFMQKSKERLITFFDLKLTAYGLADRQKYSVPAFPLRTLISKIHALKVANQCPSLKGKAETIYLADIDVDQAQTRAVLLINLSDKAASDTVYSAPERGHRRVLQKINDEGSDFSAHIVISLNPTDNVYLTILEITPGLASGKITRFLTHLFKFCSRVDRAAFTQPHPNNAVDAQGRPIRIVTRHVAQLDGHPSDELLRDLEAGTLGTIELIDKRNENLPWDNVGRTREIARTVLLRPGQVAGTNWDRIRDALARAAREHYGEARVRFKTATKIGRTVVLETEHMNLANDSKFVKKEKLEGFANPLDSSHDAINDEMRQKMLRYV
jgi:hypothetical protein